MAKGKGILIAVVVIVLLGLFGAGIYFVNTQQGVFPGDLLPDGEYNANSDCSFITNIKDGGFNDYDVLGHDTGATIEQKFIINTNYWISVDANDDGRLEGYYAILGNPGSTHETEQCNLFSEVGRTQEGLKIVKHRWFGFCGYVGICSPDRFEIDLDTNIQTPLDNEVTWFKPFNHNGTSNICSDFGKDESKVIIECTPCITGEERCEGFETERCVNEAWRNVGEIGGKCGFGKFVLGENQLIAMESFSGGSTISKTSTRYPIINFVDILPAIVIDSKDNSVLTTKLIYENLEDGEAQQIPLTQVWSLFYVIENNFQLPTICDIIDVSTGLCAKVNPGITIACSEGQFDPSLGLCVVQPESRTICPDGGRFDVVQNICIWNPPLQAVCPSGSVYNVNTETCQRTPISEFVCTSGFSYNPDTDKCEVYPESQIHCQPSYAYDTQLDQCIRFADERVVCPLGSNFNQDSGICEFTPNEPFICQVGFEYNEARNKCEFRPSQELLCGLGTYDSSKGVCVVEPPTQLVCNSGGVLTDIGNGNKACITTPQSIIRCPTGSTYNIQSDKCEIFPDQNFVCPDQFEFNQATGRCEIDVQVVCIQGSYDSDRDGCVYEPNLEYLCITGELTEENGEKVCKITPEITIVCPQFSAFNEEIDKCVRTPDINNPEETQDMEDIDNLLPWIIGGIAILVLLIVIGTLLFRRKR